MPYCTPIRGNSAGQLPADAKIVIAEMDITFLENADNASPLLFAALQVSFMSPTGQSFGGNHLGVMFNASFPAKRAANFGGYVDPPGRTAGVPYVFDGSNYLDFGMLVSSETFQPPESLVQMSRTFGYPFTIGVPIRLRIERRNEGQWLGLVDGVPFRTSFWPGTTHMDNFTSWTEYSDPANPCQVRLSNYRFTTDTGVTYTPTQFTYVDGAGVGEQRAFLDSLGIVMDVGRTGRVLANNSTVTLPTPQVSTGSTPWTHPASGVTVQVEIDWTDTNTWTDITRECRRLTVRSPHRAGLAQTFDPGSLTLVLGNEGRRYDPQNPSSPVSQYLTPGKQIRVTFSAAGVSPRQVFFGRVAQWGPIDVSPVVPDSTITVTAIDALGLAAGAIIPAGVRPLLIGSWSTVWSYAAALLAASESGMFADIGHEEDGYTDAYIGAISTDWRPSGNVNVLDEIRKASEVEQGPVVSSTTAHSLVIYPRHWFKLRPRSQSSQVTIGPTRTRRYVDFAPTITSGDAITAVGMSARNGDDAYVIDVVALAQRALRYPTQSLNDLPALNSEALNGAARTAMAVRSTLAARVQQIVVKPANNKAAWAPTIVDLRPLDRITVESRIANQGPLTARGYFVDGVEHTITGGRDMDWTTTYALSAAAPYDAAVPGDGVFLWGVTDIGDDVSIGL